MQLFKNINIDWMGKRWYFIGVSVLFFIIGWAAVIQRGGLLYSIDFTGGTLIKIKLAQKPNVDELRTLLSQKLGATDVTRYDLESKNQIQVRLKKVESEDTIAFQKLGTLVSDSLTERFDRDKAAGKLNLNRVGSGQIASRRSRRSGQDSPTGSSPW